VERETDSDVSVSVNSKKFKSLAAANKGKLVFREDKSGNLYYVDFSKNELVAKELSANVPAYHPDISPDGKWVAFCTGIEGVAEGSELYVRKIDASDKSLIKLNVKSAVIPRWRLLYRSNGIVCARFACQDGVVLEIPRHRDSCCSRFFESAVWNQCFVYPF